MNTADDMGNVKINSPGNNYELIGYNVTSSWAWGFMNCVQYIDTEYNVYVFFCKPYAAQHEITATIHTLWKRKSV